LKASLRFDVAKINFLLIILGIRCNVSSTQSILGGKSDWHNVQNVDVYKSSWCLNFSATYQVKTHFRDTSWTYSICKITWALLFPGQHTSFVVCMATYKLCSSTATHKLCCLHGNIQALLFAWQFASDIRGQRHLQCSAWLLIKRSGGERTWILFSWFQTLTIWGRSRKSPRITQVSKALN